MFCGNCGRKLSSTASFCPDCGAEVKPEKKVKSSAKKIEVAEDEKKKNNTGLIIGCIIGAFILLVIIGSSISKVTSNSGKEKMITYLENTLGYTKSTSNLYVKYNEGYTYKFDFYNELISIENSTGYSAYYYKKNTGGTTLTSSGTTIKYTFDYASKTYSCTTSPSTYQTYLCNYVKSSATSLADTMKSSFEKMLTGAGVTVDEL